MDIDLLANKGIEVLGSLENNQQKPIIVVGVARGGTSLIAGILENLGLFMGDKSCKPVFEDVHLSSFFEDGNDKKVAEIISDYKRKHKIFGWKRPSSISQLEKVDSLFNKPKYIFIFKDVLSIAGRNKISMQSESLFPSMQDALNKYSLAINFIKKFQPNSLLISYEKAMLNQNELVSTINAFCGLNAEQTAINKAIHFIDPTPSSYLNSSRITKSRGRFGGLSPNGKQLFGWANFEHKPEKTAMVKFFLNDKLLGETTANKPRKDLDSKFNKPCAFNWKVPKDITFNTGDKIRARVEGDIVDLDNSPFVIESKE